MRGKATENWTNATDQSKQRNILNVGLKLYSDQDQGHYHQTISLAQHTCGITWQEVRIDPAVET